MVARWSDGMVYQAGGQAMPEAMQSSCPGPSFGFWPTENTEICLYLFISSYQIRATVDVTSIREESRLRQADLIRYTCSEKFSHQVRRNAYKISEFKQKVMHYEVLKAI